jgi:hypothetical protein
LISSGRRTSAAPIFCSKSALNGKRAVQRLDRKCRYHAAAAGGFAERIRRLMSSKS